MTSRPSRQAPACAPHLPRPAPFPRHPALDRSPPAPRLWSAPSLRSCCTPFTMVIRGWGDREHDNALRTPITLSPSVYERQARKADQLLRDRRNGDLEQAPTPLRARLVRAISVAIDTLPEAVSLGAKGSGRDGRPRQLLCRAVRQRVGDQFRPQRHDQGGFEDAGMTRQAL